MVIAMTAPRIRPQTPCLTFSAVSGFIDNTSLTSSDLTNGIPDAPFHKERGKRSRSVFGIRDVAIPEGLQDAMSRQAQA
jgi:hypothetical protein